MHGILRRSGIKGSIGRGRRSGKRRTVAAVTVAGVVALSALVVPGATAYGAALACEPVEIDPRATPRFFPPLTSGDAEFGGNGPAITVSAKLIRTDSPSGDFLTVKVMMRAEETKSDWTKAEGTMTYLLFQADPGCDINYSLLPGKFDSNGYLARAASRGVSYGLPAGDPGEGIHNLNPSFVDHYRVHGDRLGSDVGSWTSVQVAPRRFTVNFN